MTPAALLDELRGYVAVDPPEAAMCARIITLLERHGNAALTRALQTAHVTASAWIVDPSRAYALLTHHRKLGRWLQLGGHVDGDADVRAAALREAHEESGLESLRLVSSQIYDVDVHTIPARPGEPAHEHHDIRFLIEADRGEPLVVSSESKELAWVPLENLQAYGVDESVLRLARKTPR